MVASYTALTSTLLLVAFCGYTFAVEVDSVGSRHAEKATPVDLDDQQGTGKLYFTGPGYTINLIPQAILLGLLSFLAVYFLGLDLFGSGGTAPSGYGAPSVGYGAPEPSYGAPAPSYSAPSSGYDAPSSSYTASGRYYDTYSQANADSLNNYDDARRKRSAF